MNIGFLFSLFLNLNLFLLFIHQFRSLSSQLKTETRAKHVVSYYKHQVDYFSNPIYCQLNHDDLEFQNKRQNTKILIAIKSGGKKGFQRRKMMRNTSLKYIRERLDSENVQYFFVLSKHEDQELQTQIELEMKEENDIVLFRDLVEQYRLLTQKLSALLEYAEKKYNFDYLLILDDDSFLNVWTFLNLLKSLPKHAVHRGMDVMHAPVVVNISHKNHEPNFHDSNTYPPFALGGTAILSYDLVYWLATTSSTWRMLVCDDAAMGLWLASLEQARIAYQPGVSFWRGMNGSMNVLSQPMSWLLIKDLNNLTEWQLVWNIFEKASKQI